MKILFVANVAKEHINKFHVPTIKAFKEKGWTVDVACNGDAVVPECDKQYNMCWKRSPFTFKTIKGIFELKKLLKSENYDVVYCHTPVGGLVARLAARTFRKKGTKVVYCAHGLHFFEGAPVINWIIFYPIEKILAKITDLFICINREDYERVKNKFCKDLKVFLIPGIGVPYNRLKIDNTDLVRSNYRKQLNISNDAIMITYVAEILPNKNQRMLIDTLEQLHKNNRKYYLCLVGPDYENEKMNKYAEEKGLSDYVFFLGWRNDIGEILYSSDIYAASSIREGFGINLVEAMYCGLPIVATKNRGHSAIINNRENGFLVNLGDFKQMADDISLIVDDYELRMRLSHIDVSKYECSSIAEQIVSIITYEE